MNSTFRLSNGENLEGLLAKPQARIHVPTPEPKYSFFPLVECELGLHPDRWTSTWPSELRAALIAGRALARGNRRAYAICHLRACNEEFNYDAYLRLAQDTPETTP